MKKNMTSIAIILIVLLTMNSIVFATSNNGLEKIANKSQYFKELPFTTDQVFDSKVDIDKNVKYAKIQLTEDIVSEITETILPNGDIQYKIKEGSKKDKLLIKKNGEIFVNNNKIEVETTTDYVAADSEFSIYSQMVTYETQDPMFGTDPDDYSSNLVYRHNSNVAFTNNLGSLTTGVIIGVLCHLSGIGAIIGISMSAFPGLVTTIQSYFATSSYMSIKDYQYDYDYNDDFGNAFMLKHSTYYFGETNYNGNSIHKTCYVTHVY